MLSYDVYMWTILINVLESYGNNKDMDTWVDYGLTKQKLVSTVIYIPYNNKKNRWYESRGAVICGGYIFFLKNKIC